MPMTNAQAAAALTLARTDLAQARARRAAAVADTDLQVAYDAALKSVHNSLWNVLQERYGFDATSFENIITDAGTPAGMTAQAAESVLAVLSSVLQATTTAPTAAPVADLPDNIAAPLATPITVVCATIKTVLAFSPSRITLT